MSERVGFIGLGNIGLPMAGRILHDGFSLSSSANRNREGIEALKASGLVEADNPFEVAKQSDVLITIVVNEQQTDSVLKGENGALAGLAPGSVLIVMSTVSPDYCHALAIEAAAAGIGLLDCPVSGGSSRAQQGALALICGGDPKTVERCRPVLETMGTIFHCGSVGMGQVVKLANQGLIASQYRLVEEVRAMSNAYGMDLATLMQVLSRSTGTSFVVENWDILESGWKHLAPLAKKDVDLCLAAAQAKNIAMPLIQAAGELPWD